MRHDGELLGVFADTQKTPDFSHHDMSSRHTGAAMLAKISGVSAVAAEPCSINARPTSRHSNPSSGVFKAASARTHLMLVERPQATPRGLAWARRKDAPVFDGLELESMLRLERLNLG